MMLALTLVVRDDADIIAANLEYHFSRGADTFLVTAHRASPATRDVLDRYVPGGRLVVWYEEGEGFAQGEWVTRMARHAHRELGAQWVIHVDADEFWWPNDGDLPSALSTLPGAAGGALVQRRNALPVLNEDLPFHERMVVFTRRSVNGLGESLQAKVCHRGAADVTVADGNHVVTSPTLGPIVPTDAIEVLHFPMRTFTQFETKIATGSHALRMNAALPPNVGHVWEALDELRRDGELASFYEAHVVDPARVRAGRGDETLLYDDRLARYLAERLAAT